MKRVIRNIVLLVLILVGLEQGIVFLSQYSETFKAQQHIISEEHMDPAAFFYTESEHALRAEKKLRQTLK
ncbi:hypothetical protein [Marinoscillum sp. 108]|jgi:hypothetical protein|uniref:hypothetical protein n=1 Tax=Marinoscillum sp. 108 TaxID=2653151 RepID=UPI0012F11FA5|nr:hypothetical protein [Marinoscillum sp. 108]VXD18142.1 conserved hypothetical protein [Marinoscillum sp. 108]